MAKAKKGAKKQGRAQQAAGPMAALYRLDVGTPRGDAVREALAAQGIRAKTVTEERLGDPVGAIAGLVGFRPARTPYVGPAPESEFMLLCQVPNAQMNQLLAAMREADCSVGCKAQLTQHNRLWPFVTLVSEVSREHEMMTSSGNVS